MALANKGNVVRCCKYIKSHYCSDRTWHSNHSRPVHFRLRIDALIPAQKLEMSQRSKYMVWRCKLASCSIIHAPGPPHHYQHHHDIDNDDCLFHHRRRRNQDHHQHHHHHVKPLSLPSLISPWPSKALGCCPHRISSSCCLSGWSARLPTSAPCDTAAARDLRG